MLRKVPDWLIYGFILMIIMMNIRDYNGDRLDTTPPPELGPPLPNAKPTDPTVLINIDKPKSGIGTAFTADGKGTWLTAKHVVEGCDKVALRLSGNTFVKVSVDSISRNSDTALLNSKWERAALPQDLNSPRQIGEKGFFVGFPQGKPGESIGALIGRRRMVIRGRYHSNEQILAWSEIGRTRGLIGSLGGLSGGPAFDADGEVIGLVSAESVRRGRIYTVAPTSLRALAPKNSITDKPHPINIDSFGHQADTLRRTRQVTQVYCLVQ